MVKPSTGYSAIPEFERRHVRPRAGRTLIAGSHVYAEKEDRRKRYPDVVGVDMIAGPGVDIVADLENLPPEELGQFHHIECMSILEHSRRPWLLAATLEQLLLPGGTIYVTVPFAWRFHGYPSDYWRMTPEGIKELFRGIDWKVAMFVGEGLCEGPKIPTVKENGYPYIQRSESVAFGVKK